MSASLKRTKIVFQDDPKDYSPEVETIIKIHNFFSKKISFYKIISVIHRNGGDVTKAVNDLAKGENDKENSLLFKDISAPQAVLENYFSNDN